MIYGSEEQAFRRVEVLKARGIWPGVRRADGGWELTYDPADLGDLADGLTGAGSGNRLGVNRWGLPEKPPQPRVSYPSSVFTRPRRLP